MHTALLAMLGGQVDINRDVVIGAGTQHIDWEARVLSTVLIPE